MANINWENLPSTSTPINATNLNKAGEGLVNVGTSIDSSYKTNIIVGKNLFDGILELGSYDSSGNKGVDNAQYRNANRISVIPNTTYTTSINGTAQQYVMYYYNASGTFLSSADNRTGTFTTPANCYYVNFRCYNADYTSSFATLKVQLEKGSSATSYQAYIAPSIYANEQKIYEKTESGSNANGSYIKYSDGTLICYGSKSITSNLSTAFGNWYRSDDFNINYPNSFFSKPVFLINGIGTYSIISMNWGESSSPKTVSDKFVLIRPSSQTGMTYEINWTAIGKWK